MSFTEMVHRKMTGLNILTEMQFWLHFDCINSVVHWSEIQLGTLPSFFLTKKCVTLELFYVQPGNLSTATPIAYGQKSSSHQTKTHRLL